ncbi:hypothetical protein EPUL_000623 [Erysiphe pulchra]|uniref:J domain-containing protein n=1 Tax=Erysiphe pulchra TaxID=225359 RepID=A0A2S4Q215_9PEZI|nr:hypothetical protein EPUL_000623 [Erysiphe pulchra]
MEKLPEFDFYEALGVSDNATSTEIRTSYRKLILKCHPDKVQDASLRAVKQAEFQRVQEAYETLSDERRRLEYDELLQKIEIRRQMSQGNPTPWSNPFEYEIKTPGTPNVKVYMYKNTFNGSSEEVRFSRGTPGQSTPVPESRRSSKAESAKVEAQKKKAKEDEIRRLKAEIKRKQKEEEEKRKKKEEEARQRQKEKEEAKRKQARKKEKERKEKRTRSAYVEVYDGSDDEYHTPRSSEKKPGQSKLRQEVPMNKKWTGHQDYAGAYVHASLNNPDIPYKSSPSSSYGVRFSNSTENSPRESRDKKQTTETPSVFGRKPSLKTQTSAPPDLRSIRPRRGNREHYASGTPSMPQANSYAPTPVPNISSFSHLSISNNQYPPGHSSLNRSFSTGYYPADSSHVAFAPHTQTSSTDSTAHRASFSSYNPSHNIKIVSADNVNYSPRYGYEHVNFASHSVHYTSPGYS